MKRQLALALCLILLLAVSAGCKAGEENIVFTAIVEGVGDNSILVSTTDDVGFDKASVRFAKGLKLDFDIKAGQTVKLTIKPEIAESYPVQVQAAEIELIKQDASI